MSVIDLTHVSKRYGSGEAVVTALDDITLRVEEGEYVAIVGSSGSGKSTMMNIIGCLDLATEGSYSLNGHNVSDLGEDALALVRNRMIGFIFQSFHLVPRMTALANVELPMMYAGVSKKERRERAMHMLDMVGIAGRADHRPNELSGGQQQRVAVARALTMNPPLLLADEPTGNLDSHSTADVLNLFDELHHDGHTIVLITHDQEVADRARRVLTVSDGRIVTDALNPAPEGALA